MESVTTSPALDPAASTMPAVDADPFAGMFDGLGTAEPAAAASTNSVVDLASSALGQINSATPGMDADVATAMTLLIDEVSAQLSQVDLSDPASVDALSTSLTEIMMMAGDREEGASLEAPLVEGLADTALLALNMAASDPAMGEAGISDIMMSYSDFAADYEDVVAGVTELPVATEAIFTTLVSISQSLVAEGAAVVDDGMAAVDDGMASGTGEDMMDDTGMADGTDETTEMTDTGEAVDNSGGLDTEADPADLNASESNQEALEARFIALYERLMEKQVSFKERVEPFKTDNQNAGKG